MIYRIEPCPKPRMTQRDRWARRPCVLRYRAFKDQVQLRRVKLPQPCRVIFWIAMPASWTPADRKRQQGQPHQCRPDLDNLLKALGDAVHAEDSHLWNIQAEKRWARRGAIEVLPVQDACAICGCTEDDCSQCVEKTGEPCQWVEPGLCSACAPQKVGQR